MEVFLAEYGLSTDEGVALMCLAEALLRVPDAETIDALIEDKIAPSRLGPAPGPFVVLAGQRLDLGADADRPRAGRRHSPASRGALRGAVKRLGEPVIRTAVGRAMTEMGRQFVLGETIARRDEARPRAWRPRATPTPTTCWARRRAPRPTPRAITPPMPTPSPPSPRPASPTTCRTQPRHLGQAVGAASALRRGASATG